MAGVIIGSPAQGLRLSRDGEGDLRAELVCPGLFATTVCEPSYGSELDDVVAFFRGLAEDWRGWDGARSWTSVDHALSLSALHGGSHVAIQVTLRDVEQDWSCSGTVVVEAGEQLSAVHGDVATLDHGRR